MISNSLSCLWLESLKITLMGTLNGVVPLIRNSLKQDYHLTSIPVEPSQLHHCLNQGAHKPSAEKITPFLFLETI